MRTARGELAVPDPHGNGRGSFADTDPDAFALAITDPLPHSNDPSDF